MGERRFTAEAETRAFALKLVNEAKPFFSMSRDEDPIEAARKHVEMARIYAEYLRLEWEVPPTAREAMSLTPKEGE